LDAVGGGWDGVAGGAAAKVAATIVPMLAADVSAFGPAAQLSNAKESPQHSSASRTEDAGGRGNFDSM
jgi:hypothetical protein